ncbi:hypothetical protein JCM9957A_30980 [Kineosporia succinea]
MPGSSFINNAVHKPALQRFSANGRPGLVPKFSTEQFSPMRRSNDCDGETAQRYPQGSIWPILAVHIGGKAGDLASSLGCDEVLDLRTVRVVESMSRAERKA